MHNDPMLYIIAAAMLGGVLGFFGCALVASKSIRESRDDAFQDGYETCNRDHHNKRL